MSQSTRSVLKTLVIVSVVRCDMSVTQVLSCDTVNQVCVLRTLVIVSGVQ